MNSDRRAPRNQAREHVAPEFIGAERKPGVPMGFSRLNIDAANGSSGISNGAAIAITMNARMMAAPSIACGFAHETPQHIGAVTARARQRSGE